MTLVLIVQTTRTLASVPCVVVQMQKSCLDTVTFCIGIGCTIDLFAFRDLYRRLHQASLERRKKRGLTDVYYQYTGQRLTACRLEVSVVGINIKFRKAVAALVLNSSCRPARSLHPHKPCRVSACGSEKPCAEILACEDGTFQNIMDIWGRERKTQRKKKTESEKSKGECTRARE